jgi:hypothetical protein
MGTPCGSELSSTGAVPQLGRIAVIAKAKPEAATSSRRQSALDGALHMATTLADVLDEVEGSVGRTWGGSLREPTAGLRITGAGLAQKYGKDVMLH